MKAEGTVLLVYKTDLSGCLGLTIIPGIILWDGARLPPGGIQGGSSNNRNFILSVKEEYGIYVFGK